MKQVESQRKSHYPPTRMPAQICAVIVTYNRRVLLEECLTAVLRQTARPALLLVVDNASTDGTAELFVKGCFADEPAIRYVSMATNAGGAGGFRHGMDLAFQSGYEWIWLMDDDTIPTPTALAELLAAYFRFPENERPAILGSIVRWTDGSLHPMNFPTIRRADHNCERAILAAAHSTLWARWVSFVSALIHRSAIAAHGLPYGDYFIWNDDTEYTARVLRHGLGVIVPGSVVFHKTAQKHSPMDATPERMYYQVRNVLWMILRSDAWERQEKIKVGLFNLHRTLSYLRRSHTFGRALRCVLAGVRDGLFKRPQK